MEKKNDPEIKVPYNHKMDVYSFGIAAYIILSGKNYSPYDVNPQTFAIKVLNGLRPPIDKLSSSYPSKLVFYYNLYLFYYLNNFFNTFYFLFFFILIIKFILIILFIYLFLFLDQVDRIVFEKIS